MKKTKSLTALQIMTKPVETVRTVDSIQDVAYLFTEKNIGAAIVIDGDKNPIGVITKTDVVRFENENARTVQKKTDVVADDQSVLSWMTPVIFTVPPEVPVSEIAKRMIKYGVHHIFVRNPKQKSIVGVVSTFDILQQVASFTEEV
jgi:CBS domain-containing protein